MNAINMAKFLIIGHLSLGIRIFILERNLINVTFVARILPKDHKMGHTEVVPYKCKGCGKTFP